MKKIILSLFALAIIVACVNVPSVNAEEVIYGNSFTLEVMRPKVTNKNLNLEVEDGLITLNYLTSQRGDSGMIIYYNDGYHPIFVPNQDETNYTYHTVRAFLTPGEYEVQPYSVSENGTIMIGNVLSVTIK